MSHSPDLLSASPAIAGAPAVHRSDILVRRSTGERRSLWRELTVAVREVWASRELIHQMVLRDIRVRYHQALMGFAWALFMPLMIVLSGTLIRVVMATASGSVLRPELIGATAVKGLGWAFFSGALGNATQSLLANKALITKLYFPREVLPLSSMFAQTFDTTIGTVAVLVMLPFLGLTVSPTLLWLPVLAALLFLLTLVASLVTSCANLFFRDVKYIVQMFLTFGIFLTPVFFEPAMLGPLGARLMMLNPISPLIEGLRLALIDGHNLLTPHVVTTPKGAEVLAWSPFYLLYSAVVAIGGLVVAMRVFRRASVVFAEYA